MLPGNFYPVGWSPDSQSVYAYEYLGKKSRESVRECRHVAANVGVSAQGALDGSNVEPTGTSMVCSVRETKSDAWLIDNFDRKDPKNRQ